LEAFKVTKATVEKALKMPLPAWEGQKAMSLFQDEYLRKKGSENAKRAAVMIIIEEQSQEIIIIERSAHPLDKHKGQMSFPGGQFDLNADKTLLDTAIRETKEEINLYIPKEEVIGPLSPLYIPVSNFSVQPFVTTLKEVDQLKAQPSEVAQIWRFNLHTIFNDIVHRTEMKLATGLQLNKVPYYPLQEKKVWGATAMILAELSFVLKPYILTSNK